MTAELTDRIITQGKALVRAIEALPTTEPTDPFERALARLRAIVAAAPTWVSEGMLSTSERGKAAPPFDLCPELQYTMCA